jgi:hypothetical protein
VIALLLFLLAQPVSETIPRFNRAEWKHWIDVDHDCQDTRQEVLIAESRQPVKLTPDGCRVVWGDWLDPYTGEQTNNPKALDVDHVCALGWAAAAGGWRWGRATKQAYANDLDAPEHLRAVMLEANRAKGSKGPDRWRPRRADWCDYATAWTAIAKRWDLTLTVSEIMALREMSATCP